MTNAIKHANTYFYVLIYILFASADLELAAITVVFNNRCDLIYDFKEWLVAEFIR